MCETQRWMKCESGRGDAGWRRKGAGASCFPLRGLPVSEGSSARPARHTPVFQGCQHAFHNVVFPSVIQKLFDWNLLPRRALGLGWAVARLVGRDTSWGAEGGDDTPTVLCRQMTSR